MKTMLIDILKRRDLASGGLLLAIGMAAVWVGLLPFSRQVQDAYLRRFHLASPVFAGWAVQQLTPAMYNLENSYVFSPQWLSPEQRHALQDRYFVRLEGRCPGGAGALGTHVRLGMLNHFPTREMTFAQSRGQLIQSGHGHFHFHSRYRGREIQSAFEIQPLGPSRAKIIHREVELE